MNDIANTPDGPGLVDRLFARLRSLFIPSVSVAAVLSTLGSSDPQDAVKQLFTWERERLLTLAKGAAAAAITVLTGLVAAAVKGEVHASPLVVYLAATLVLQLLLWGGFILTGLRRLAEEYALALSIVGSE